MNELVNRHISVRTKVFYGMGAIAVGFDAVSDPLIGSLSDKWRSKLGRRHPFIFIAAIKSVKNNTKRFVDN